MKKPLLLGISAALLILLFVVGSFVYKNKQIEKLGFLAQDEAELFVRSHSAILGSDTAKVYLVEFMDPACETCAAFSPFVKKLMAANPGKIKLVLRYAPFHQGADYFVRILEASKKQGKYWQTLATMFQSQPYWASHHQPRPELIWRFLEGAGLDLDKIRKDMEDPAITRIIEQDLADAKRLNVTKTPGFFANGKPLVTFGYRELQLLVEQELKAAYPE
ncbi:MAG: thioredoxin domain-containing protein [Proteobacteria bacterium]|nr:thioredoxin domain-containing protein [Pseudomonadota bacterium]MBU1641613.1 thioredoxin domain-containing protein [Pseudomonadota bacterium]